VIARILTVVLLIAIGIFIGAKNPGLISKVGL
jgi:hypothetical protein